MYKWCFQNIKLETQTIQNFNDITTDLYCACDLKAKKIDNDGANVSINPIQYDITTAIFRYKQGYECEYETNSELPIDIAITEYRKYLDWKFKKSEV